MANLRNESAHKTLSRTMVFATYDCQCVLDDNLVTVLKQGQPSFTVLLDIDGTARESGLCTVSKSVQFSRQGQTLVLRFAHVSCH